MPATKISQGRFRTLTSPDRLRGRELSTPDRSARRAGEHLEELEGGLHLPSKVEGMEAVILPDGSVAVGAKAWAAAERESYVRQLGESTINATWGDGSEEALDSAHEVVMEACTEAMNAAATNTTLQSVATKNARRSYRMQQRHQPHSSDV